MCKGENRKMKQISKTKFEKDLRSIIFKEDYRIDLYKKGQYTGCIVLENKVDKSLTKADVMADFEIEKRVEYDYENDNGENWEHLALWQSNAVGYCFYEFDSWKVSCL